MDALKPSSGIRRFLVPKFIIPASIVAVVGAAVILIWFQPQKLFIDTQVDEGAPGATGKADEARVKDDAIVEEEMMSFSGNFRGVGHKTSGKTLLEKADDGHYYVRFENFETENGPDLFVYLSSTSGDAEESQFPGEFV